ncbi:ATP-binding protein [Limosilactobacillus albertensis]|uniref:ATP-binding protein n=1 Tax=Limosilactobacillus albertensis TaxID=2759752 RepID=A0A839HBT1_9LACO|nr:ATP-binding protein [Limosilactobacillus albertensis]MBB1124419.1 ATP-binding protein [Limosilactobacillus albertensis]MCD7123167.1 ATP-binding protein [Limosilactobacillus albertensis]
MKIDDLYKDINKEEFYIGQVSLVSSEYSYIQAENLAVLNPRIINRSQIVPNTVNYLVIIDNIQGLFIGEVVKAEVKNNNTIHTAMIRDEKKKVFPQLEIKLLGILKEKVLTFTGAKNVGLSDKAYLASKEVVKRAINSLDSFLINNENRNPLKEIGTVKSLGEELPFNIDPNSLFNRHLLIVGATNSGKSTSSLKILEEYNKIGKKFILIDPTGEYRDSFKQFKKVRKLKLGEDTTVNPGYVNMRQWEMLFQTNNESQAPALDDAIRELKYLYPGQEVFKKEGKAFSEIQDELIKIRNQEDNGAFDLRLLSKQIRADSVKIDTKWNSPTQGKYIFDSFKYNANEWLIEKVEHIQTVSEINKFFTNDKGKDLFTKLNDFITDETSLYIDASLISVTHIVGATIIELISEYLFNHKENKKENKAFILCIDEAHRYLLNNSFDNIGLVNIAREGRKKGIFLFLTTQSPKDIPPIILSQIGTVIIHRLTNSEDINIVRNYLTRDSIGQISSLNSGEAIISSINLIGNVLIKFNRSQLDHYNKTQLL